MPQKSSAESMARRKRSNDANAPGITRKRSEEVVTSRSGHIELSDAAERHRAIQTFDRNLVVTAGAGTGKTTLLVERLVHLLLRNPDPLRITEIVALTFTNKA